MVGRTRIAVTLTRSRPGLREQVDAALRAGAELIELRVDLISDVEAVDALLRQPHAIPYILTVRRAEEGGAWCGAEAERIALLERLARHVPGLVDLELAAWQNSAEARARIAGVCRVGGGADLASPGAGGLPAPGLGNLLILSHHDLSGTPTNLDAVFERLEASPANITKAAFTAREALEACRVLEQLQRRGSAGNVIALAMGAAGLATRVLARKFGAFLTFAAAEPGAESAPGQPTVAELRHIYRWDEIDEHTPVFGVIGWPVTRSLSPRVHNAAMAAAGIDGVYVPLPVGPAYEDLAAFLDYVTASRWLDVAGLSVTIPHKEHAARWLVERGYRLSPLACRCGAVNTLVRTGDGDWRGENTDAPGALEALETVPALAGGQLAGATADVLGAGGAAAAIAAALLDRGCRVTIYNRTSSRGAALAQRLRCGWRPWEERAGGTGRIIINCTSVGMGADAASSPVPSERFTPDTVAFDVVYDPPETRFLREARARGCRTVSGAELFIGQASAQFTLWHGRQAPRDVMRRALEAAAERRQSK